MNALLTVHRPIERTVMPEVIIGQSCGGRDTRVSSAQRLTPLSRAEEVQGDKALYNELQGIGVLS